MTGSATAADQGQQPENRQQALGTIKPVELPPAEPEQNQVKIGTGESCSPIASSAQAALGGAVKACVETKPLESASTVTARRAGRRC
ncbi:hypothetical protein ACIQCD_30865 [Streptomyces sp. NPDC093250]|uniref:hypothetical protein n=1 Tax=Streptomyces sp. NPDC093250 TaxID=3366036 RepID=UPI0037F79200